MGYPVHHFLSYLKVLCLDFQDNLPSIYNIIHDLRDQSEAGSMQHILRVTELLVLQMKYLDKSLLGYGFCEYSDQETAMSAMRNLNGRELHGRNLRVDHATRDHGVDPKVENLFSQIVKLTLGYTSKCNAIRNIGSWWSSSSSC